MVPESGLAIQTRSPCAGEKCAPGDRGQTI